MFLTAPDLASIPSIRHGFFTRKGGVSGGIYASLNCGFGSRDEAGHVEENRARVVVALGVRPPDNENAPSALSHVDREMRRRARDEPTALREPSALCSLYQVHGNNVARVTEAWGRDAMPQADAMVTDVPGIALGILTADCVPVLFADAQAGVIGAAHSGWKGTYADIPAVTVAAMAALGAEPSRIVAAIGPAIGFASYEVDSAFRDRFLQLNRMHQVHFISGDDISHYRFDIKSCVRDCLRKAGVGTINLLENDTYLEEDDFFSFRRATHRREPDYGRQISAITLTSRV